MKFEVGFTSIAVGGNGAICVWAGFNRRADMVGGGDPGAGKCTIEVDVDGSAEVSVSGDTGD